MFKILILITIFYKAYCKDTAPVFIIDHLNVIRNELVANPLAAMTEAHFEKLVHETRESSEFIIVFVEDKFCQEDITVKDDLGTPFHHLRQGIIEKKVKYLPAVHQPYKVLERNFQPTMSNSYYVTSLNFKPDVSIRGNRIAYIFFKDGISDSRAKVLRKHDVLMREIYFSMSRNSRRRIVAFYTGRKNPIVIDKIHYKIRRLYENIDINNYIDDSGITVRSKRAMFHFKGMAKSIGGRRTGLNEMPMFIGETHSENSIRTKLSYPEFDLHFDIDYNDRYWILRRVSCMVDNIPVGLRYIDMPISWGKSYVCGDPLTIRYRRGGDIITIPHMQVQPFIEGLKNREGAEIPDGPPQGDNVGGPGGNAGGAGGNAGGAGGNAGKGDDAGGDPASDAAMSFNFGPVEECTGYFSQNILACLFVVLILISALYYGISMLMAVETNDQFDDFRKPYCFGGQRAE